MNLKVEASPAVERVRSDQFFVATTSFVALFSIVGLALYGLPFFYDFMVKEFGWTRAQVTSGNALSKLVVGPLFGYLAGWMVDRFGPRRLMLVGIFLAGLALVGLGNMTVLWMFYFFYLFNALGYVCAGPLPNQVLLARWFDKARGKAMGFAYLGIGIGGTLVPWLAYWLEQRFGWRIALSLLGLMIIVVTMPLAYFVKESPEAAAQRRAAAGSPEVTKAETVPIGWAFKSGAFFLLAIGSMCSIGAVGGVNQNLKLFLSLDVFRALEPSDAQARAATVASLVLAFSMVGRILMGWLADRYTKKYVMLLIYLLVAGAIPLLFFADQPGVLYLFAIIFGIGLGGDYMIIPLMAAELFGVKVMGRVMGLILTADGAAEALVPMLVGIVRDSTGSYAWGFVVLISLALFGALAVAFLPKGKAEVKT